MKYQENYNEYSISIYEDSMFTPDSTDNKYSYQNIYRADDSCYSVSKHAVRIEKDEQLVSSAIILGIGGGTTIHPHSYIIHEDSILICCGEMIFCLSIPDLKLKWKTEIDHVTAFGIYKMQNDFIIHGEMSISRINKNGEIIWENSGSDIFVTEEGENDFIIRNDLIYAISWDGRKYIFDYEGKTIENSRITATEKKNVNKGRFMHIIIIVAVLLSILFIFRMVRKKSYIPKMKQEIHKSIIEDFQYTLGAGINERDIDFFEWTPLHKACFIGEADIVKQLLERNANTEILNASGETPLTVALLSSVSIDNYDCIDLLLKSGADINIRNKNGETPLMSALDKRFLELILSYSPSINLQDNNGKTVLHHCIRRPDLSTLKRIIQEEDLDVTIKDNKGFTALDLAINQGFKEAIEILKEIP